MQHGLQAHAGACLRIFAHFFSWGMGPIQQLTQTSTGKEMEERWAKTSQYVQFMLTFTAITTGAVSYVLCS